MKKTDRELIAESVQGTHVAFDELMKRYQSKVYAIAFGFSKNQHDAMDLTQDIFLKAFRKLSTLKSGEHFRSWLQKIAYNEGNNWMRQSQDHKNEELFDESMHGIVTVEDEALADTHRKALIRCLFSLNTRYRLVVVLRYFEKMSIREISEVMRCREGMVKNILFRSLTRLKEELGNEDKTRIL